MRVDLSENPPSQIVYEVHIEPPVEHAAHYIGRSPDGGISGLVRRLAKHGGSEGARLLQVAKQRGSTWHLVRTWEGGGRKERQLKTRSGALYCPECAEHPLPGNREPRQDAKYLTRRQREEKRHAQAQREKDPYADMHAEELTYSEVADRLTVTQRSTPEDWEKAIPYIEALEAGWLREKQEREMRQEMEAAAEAATETFTAMADAGVEPGRIATWHDEVAAELWNDAETAEAKAFARGYDDTVRTLVRDLEEAELAPMAATLPDGAPHADPFLAARGWEAQGGIYRRAGQAERELEAG
jgi:hypothetical protein